MMRNLTYLISGFLFLFALNNCSPKKISDLNKAVLIPKPLAVKASGEVFELTRNTGIYYQDQSEEAHKIGQYLAEKLNPSTGFNLQVLSSDQKTRTNFILLTLNKHPQLGDEGYALNISKKGITLQANEAAGLFRGVQTLRQLFPVSIEKNSLQKGPWEVAGGKITDYPAYSYRSAMLDVARHFFGVEEVKHYIDLLAFYKINTLHLHLSDDQGWRIEIKSWPELTKIGGSTEVGGGKGGFYTQQQYKEIVRYADERYITIIPEIDMPGHTNAALASYAELNCDGEKKDLYTGTDVGFSTLCVHKEITYRFIDDVIRELAAMTTGDYIHIGGDESHSTPMEDYIPFITRVQDIVASHGKIVMGWDEVANTQLKPNTIVEYWAIQENAIKAVEQGAKVIIAPGHKTYLDMQYDSLTPLGLHWAGYVSVEQAYNWAPDTLVEGIANKDIIGIESPLWTETITNRNELEYMVFPRLIGHAEIGWTPSSQRNWDEYQLRLRKHIKRLDAMNVNYYRWWVSPDFNQPKSDSLP
jgi:hexosaminidase